jgi:RTX calcium-binding nonapeptide repeat (4 copies)
MAIYRVSSTGAAGTLASVSAFNTRAFSGGTTLADTLTIDADAFLISQWTTTTLSTVYLNSLGPWTVNVNGDVAAYGGMLSDAFDIRAADSRVTIGETGSVFSSGYAFDVSGANFTLTNNGTVAGDIITRGAGIHTITNNGDMLNVSFYGNNVAAERFTNTGIFGGDVYLGGGNDNITNSGTINGEVDMSSGDDAVTNSGTMKQTIFMGSGTNTLTNSGSIAASSTSFRSYVGTSGSDRVTNSGVMNGTMVLGEGVNSVNNLSGGSIRAVKVDGTALPGGAIIGGASTDSVTNAGIIYGKVNLGNGTNTLNNTGTISASGVEDAYSGGTGADRVTNSGYISGNMLLGEGTNSFTNSGTLNGRVIAGLGADTFINSGTIASSVSLGGGTNNFTNSGIVSGDIFGAGGADTVTLSTGSYAFSMSLTAGEDVVTNNGSLTIYSDGAGNDSFNSQNGIVSRVTDGEGNDFYVFGSDGTTFYGNSTAGNVNSVNAGTGNDSYHLTFLVGTFTNNYINLSTVAQTGNGVTIAANSVVSESVLVDSIFNFENVFGTATNDTILGTSGANYLDGAGGNDYLSGGAGNDTLVGGIGIDKLFGGTGIDTLTGGELKDTFIYTAINQSGTTLATRDVITDFDFSINPDVIDLSAIDASTVVAGNQSFVFIGTNLNWTNAASELRVRWTATGQIIEGDVNGDNVADFSIFVADGGNHQEFTGDEFLF